MNSQHPLLLSLEAAYEEIMATSWSNFVAGKVRGKPVTGKAEQVPRKESSEFFNSSMFLVKLQLVDS